MSAARSFVGRLAAVGAGLCAAAALAAQGGRVSVRLDVLTHFAPLYALGALMAVVLALLAGRARGVTALLAILAVGSVAALIAPEYRRSGPPPAAPDPAGQVKIVQFNALRRNADIGRVADWLIAEQPDIVTLQEARHDLRDLLRARTGWRVAGARENVMIFSRERRLQMARPEAPGSALTFVNATYPSESGPFEVVTAHLDWPTYDTFPRQLDGLRVVTAARPRERMILTGDFNAAPWSFAMRRLDRELGLRRVDRALWSFPARVGDGAWRAPVLPIDHVYVGPGWAVVKVERGPYLGSDHYPLVVTLAPASPR